MLQDMTLKS